MKKRSIAARLGVAALALTLVTTSLSSGTLAKYIDTFSGKATLQVAAWNVGASLGGQPMTTGSTSVDLVKTVTGIKEKTVRGTGSGDNFKAAYLAPGMESSFAIEVTNQGDEGGPATDVAVDYFIFMKPASDSQTPANFLFWDEAVNAGGADPSNMMQFTGDADDVTEAGDGYGWIVARGVMEPTTDSGMKKTVTVGWRWPYQTEETGLEATKAAENKEDTNNGMPKGTVRDGYDANLMMGQQSTTFAVTVVLVQHDPSVAIPANPSDPDTGIQWSR